LSVHWIMAMSLFLYPDPGASLCRFSDLADQELVPLPLTEQGDPRQIDSLHRFELFKHCQEKRALQGLAEALQIPEQVLARADFSATKFQTLNTLNPEP